MKNFDVQGIELAVPASQAWRAIADPGRLPDWTRAFSKVEDGRAVLKTPNGAVTIGLEVAASEPHGTVDWTMTFPDGSVGHANSRVVPLGAQRCVYAFVLLPPPVPLEQLEGALAAQSLTLAEELRRLKALLERGLQEQAEAGSERIAS
jgi:hypothetical protein